MTLLEHAQARLTAASACPEAASARHTHVALHAALHRMYPPLPTGESRLDTYLAFISNARTSALLRCTRNARCGLTLGDPWLPDGVPVLILDGLPIIANTNKHPSITIINPINPVPHGLPSTAEELHVVLGAGAPVPHPLMAVEDVATVIKQGQPYMPVLAPTFHPDLQEVLRVSRAEGVSAICFLILHIAAMCASMLIPLLIAEPFLERANASGTLGDALLAASGLLIGGCTMMSLLLFSIRTPMRWQNMRRARLLGL